MNLDLLSRLNSLRVALDALEVKLPLRVATNDVGCVQDADGEDVFVVDVNNERDDEQVKAISTIIVTLVNAAAGVAPSAETVPAERKVA